MKHVVIIGGGISGLATGALLGKKGLKVTLVEKNATLGGRARTYKKKGYIFDMGPSWYMMPEVFEKFFSNFNKKSSDFYSLTKLNPRYEVVFDDDTSFIANNISDDVHAFEKFEKGSSEKIKTYLTQMKKSIRHL
jgi:phytoene desaturase